MLDVVVGNLAEGTAEEGHPCNPSGGTCTGSPSTFEDRRVVGEDNRTAVALLDIPFSL